MIIQLYFLSEDCPGELLFKFVLFPHSAKPLSTGSASHHKNHRNPVPGKKPFCPRSFDAAFNLKFIKYENEPKEISSAHPGSFSRAFSWRCRRCCPLELASCEIFAHFRVCVQKFFPFCKNAQRRAGERSIFVRLKICVYVCGGGD